MCYVNCNNFMFDLSLHSTYLTPSSEENLYNLALLQCTGTVMTRSQTFTHHTPKLLNLVSSSS